MFVFTDRPALRRSDANEVTILVSHNVSFGPAPSNSVIMQELKKKNVKILSEKVLLLLNRGGEKASLC